MENEDIQESEDLQCLNQKEQWWGLYTHSGMLFLTPRLSFLLLLRCLVKNLQSPPRLTFSYLRESSALAILIPIA